MTLILLLLVAFALLIGYGLGRSAVPSLRRLEEHLEAISSSLSQLAKDLCRDKGIERSIPLTNAAGGELSTEDRAYTGGSLNKIERGIKNPLGGGGGPRGTPEKKTTNTGKGAERTKRIRKKKKNKKKKKKPPPSKHP